MKINFLLKTILLFTFSSLILSCGGRNNVSRATGWGINSKQGGFQYNVDFDDQETGPGLVFVEGGTYTKGQVQDDVLHDWNNSPTQQHVMSFYMDETEVTNLMYMEYLNWLETVFPLSNEDYRQIYKGALPDTLVWRNTLGYMEELTSNYLRHPAYSEYPVVGVNWLQAVQFAEWRTNRVNEYLLEREAYIQKDVRYSETDGGIVNSNSTFSTDAYLKRPQTAYGGLMASDSLMGKRGTMKKDTATINVYAGVEKGLLQPSYRLPTETEWEYAAIALVGDREYNTYRGKKKYPWSGEYTRSDERRSEGDQLANFKFGRGDYGGIAGWSDDGGDITVQVKSYPPNDFGVYDMAGNVAEWVSDVYRPIIDDEANDFNYFRGNIYLKNAIGEDGTATIVSPDELVYDTLPNGKVLLKRAPGQLDKIPIDEEDKNSIVNNPDSRSESTLMYDAPNHPKSTKDPDGKINRNIDKANSRTSLITDEVRVYKGGSWKDRAYWLDPAQRRYLPQYIATDYIGFRCAMSRLGQKSKIKKTARHKRGR